MKKVIVNNKALKNTIALLNKAIDKKTAMPVLEQVKITFNNDCIIFKIYSLIDSGLEFTARLELDETSENHEKTFMINFLELNEIVRTFDNNGFCEIGHIMAMDCTETFKLSFESNDILYRFDVSINYDDMPAFENLPGYQNQEQKTAYIEASNMLDITEAVNFSMANQDVRYYLNGAKFEIKNGLLSVVASDGHRLALKEKSVTGENKSSPFVVTRETMLLLNDTIKKTSATGLKIIFSSDYIKFELSNGYTIESKLIDCKYPDFSRVVNEPMKENSFTFEKDYMLKVLKSLEKTANKEFKGLMIKKDDNGLTIETPRATATINPDTVTGSFEIGVNATYLIAAITKNPEQMQTINIPDNKGFVMNNTTGGFSIVMAMRL